MRSRVLIAVLATLAGLIAIRSAPAHEVGSTIFTPAGSHRCARRCRSTSSSSGYEPDR